MWRSLARRPSARLSRSSASRRATVESASPTSSTSPSAPGSCALKGPGTWKSPPSGTTATTASVRPAKPAKLRAGLKRLERNAAVVGHVKFWEHMLTTRTQRLRPPTASPSGSARCEPSVSPWASKIGRGREVAPVLQPPRRQTLDGRRQNDRQRAGGGASHDRDRFWRAATRVCTAPATYRPPLRHRLLRSRRPR